MEAVLIILTLCATVFGCIYYTLFTRNKERMALIAAGADASLFQADPNKRRRHPAYSIVLVLGLMLTGVGLGILTALIISTVAEVKIYEEGPLYMSTIFLFGGLGLVTSFLSLRKLDKADSLKK
ncbi:DUF6249 domain-containing protein [Penaeicola halotolerans]|uniref:DUF6249 domain-containing protein n=1 Tax=Penaeicola halotolerans TaxID=2793196 RepID=UPI001CF88B6D|nr:DUF6249 domain-containing protein [Penaeicola halotolerans]